MLVLTRKAGQRVLIGENIAVTVVKITGGGVRIGIEAPPELAIVREELQQEIRESEAGPVDAGPIDSIEKSES